jgi:hypothetical protein
LAFVEFSKFCFFENESSQSKQKKSLLRKSERIYRTKAKYLKSKKRVMITTKTMTKTMTMTMTMTKTTMEMKTKTRMMMRVMVKMAKTMKEIVIVLKNLESVTNIYKKKN